MWWKDTGKTNSISNVKTCLFLHHKQTQQQQPNFIVAWQLQTQQSCSTTPSFTFSFCPFSTVQNSMWWAKSISTEHKSSFYLERWAANLNYRYPEEEEEEVSFIVIMCSHITNSQHTPEGCYISGSVCVCL